MNPFATVSGGGILWFFGIAVLAIIIYLLVRILRGKGLPKLSWSLKSVKLKTEKMGDDYTLCFNVYPDKIACEPMRKKDVCKGAHLWKIGNKDHYYQGFKDNGFTALSLPKDISFLPETLARMMGCEPLKKLKSLKFSWLEHLAPFAPVVALVVAGILFLIIVG